MALQSKEAALRRVERSAELRAAGQWTFLRGEKNPRWQGGKAAAVRRRTESGKNAEMLRRYREKNPEKVREFARRRRRLTLQGLPRGTVRQIGAAQKWRCAICRASIKRGYHLDHIMPLARGGEHIPRNLQLLCEPCNVRKSAKDPIDYMQEIGRLL